ncbi:MAG: iron ABC transporter permease [Candidatus Methanomethylophilaceae archaeon]|nr:iron ABC transporter permease [Candidatus Methanomethylophilaceae archaeon]MBP5684813.1 iron ABC transporter permease [Candidatus Methanomethylophilaceae archaeon]
MGEETVAKEMSNVKQAKKRAILLIVPGIIAVILLYIYSLTIGAYSISFDEALNHFIEIISTLGNPEDLGAKVIMQLRMPRSLAVILVGSGLAIAGAVMQALIHNPLVDPYVTGVSSGASFGVILLTLGGVISATDFTTMWFIPIGAVLGAVGGFMVTMLVAESAGGKAMSYVLGGTIIAAGLSAATTLILSFNADRMHSITMWMFGSFSSITWNNILVMIVPIVVILFFILLQARKLNVMLLGETQAQYLGMNSHNYKRNMLILTAVLTAFCVAFCGTIGFIGLIVPHLCRMVVGGDHRVLIPTSMVVGSVVLLAADIICKSGTAGELPIGAITAVVGVPFFVYLMVKEGKRYAM